jgi:uncharacterized membrane protein
MTSTTIKNRINSIDLLRGVVMIIMALDHTRDFFHYDVFFFSPTDLTQTNPILFFTRFITHYCAPTFVLLAGTSAFLVGQKRGKKELSIWLVKRGVWLLFVEIVIVKFAWLFNFNPEIILLGVIWAIGAGMIVLAGLIHLPKKWILIISLIFIFGHNAFDGFAPETLSALWAFLHVQTIIPTAFTNIFVVYPLIPWVFVMSLGYCLGAIYTPNFEPKRRFKILLTSGISFTLLFFLLRGINVYGDARLWQNDDSTWISIMSFFNVSKYPPSLLYLLVTLGPALIFLALTEKLKGKIVDGIVIIGRVPMFYYIAHIFLIHALAMVAVVATGFPASEMIIERFVTMQKGLQGYGFSLGVVYLIWIAIVAMLYPTCRWYNTYKANNRDKWWLSYL